MLLTGACNPKLSDPRRLPRRPASAGKVPSLDIIGEMSSSFNYGQTLRIARDTAGALGDVAAHAKYAAAFTAVQAAFHKVYYSPAKKTYGDGTQAALTYALYLEAAPAGELDAAAFAELVRVIYAGTPECDSTPCVDTGILATKWMMELLSVRGRTDVGLDLAFKTDFPSWVSRRVGGWVGGWVSE